MRHNFFNSKLAAAFQSMEVRNSTFACFIELCTPNTYVMVVISDPTICKYRHFELHLFFRSLFSFGSNFDEYS
jgi:hypothetical protein